MSVVVVGVGHTKFDELWDKSLQDLLFQAQHEALIDAGLCTTDVDKIIVGSMSSQSLLRQSLLGCVASEVLGISVPSYHIDAACASGGVAIHAAVAEIQAGRADVVLVSGVEKMSDASVEQVTSAMINAGDIETEAFCGATIPGLFALVARAYMHLHGATREDFAHVSVKNHAHGFLNPLAQLRKKLSIQQVLNAPVVADPLTLLDCSPISDGAASLVLCSSDFAKKLNVKSIAITASQVATDTVSLALRDDLATFKATKKAATKAFAQAKITHQDIDVIEVHDAFSVAELMALEDLGFFKPGCAAQATRDGVTSLHGKLPVNPSGGLKAKGHPVGATGVAQAVEIVKQLQGRCEQRQVPNARIGLTQNVGGIGTTVAIHIFEKREQ
ncbi:MAG: thiolase domain-containing protein [bacterium]